MEYSMPWQDTSLSFEQRAEDLLSKLTLEEKVSQMIYNASALYRFGISEYNWWNECLHGVARQGTATVFPQAIGMAATFDETLIENVATAISDEARAKYHESARYGDHGLYKGLTYWSPNVNIFRDPRWGRGHETYGEDPFLSARLGVAFCKGLQGNHPKYLKTIATPKHFAVHSGPESLRHEFDAKVSLKDLRETYLPAFKACIQEAGAYSIMGAYNRTNGDPCCASTELLQHILREEWGFQGYVVSDCGAIADIHEHHKVTKTPEQSAALAVQNGCDLNCGKIFSALCQSAKMGLIPESQINASVYRLLLARFKLGMFDPDYIVEYAQIPASVNDCPEHHQLSLDVSRRSLVLLKNDGILPLRKEAYKTIAVIGPNANNHRALLGNYEGTPSIDYTPLQGIQAMFPEARVLYAEGCDIAGDAKDSAWGRTNDWGYAEAMSASRRADLTILCLGLDAGYEGEESAMSSEGGDKQDILLPPQQRQLLECICSLGKPVILINMTGSAMDLNYADQHCNAIIQAWYPGQFGGLAIAQTLLGLVSPSGRLPITFYHDMEQLPPFTDYSMNNRTYRYLQTSPLYSFGYGLSYTDFTYSNLIVDGEMSTSGNIEVHITVENTGNYSGRETVQLYIQDLESDTRLANYALRGIRSVFLSPDHKATLIFTLNASDFTVVKDDGTCLVEPGKFIIYVGGQQPDVRSTQLTGKQVLSAEVTLTGNVMPGDY